MSACMRLPSCMGTMTLRSMIATASSCCSMALRLAMTAASCAGRTWEYALGEHAKQTIAAVANLNLGCIRDLERCAGGSEPVEQIYCTGASTRHRTKKEEGRSRETGAPRVLLRVRWLFLFRGGLVARADLLAGGVEDTLDVCRVRSIGIELKILLVSLAATFG